MPTAKPQDTAQAVGKTSLAKQPAPATGDRGRSKAAQRSGRGGPRTPRMLPKSAAPATVSGGGGNCPVHPDVRGGGNAPPFYVPVVASAGKPLMPCHPARARGLVRKGRAVRRFRKGFFYIQLVDRADGDVQPVACGMDPGSKREGITMTCITPLRFHRRQLHRLQPEKGGVRKPYGSTRSHGFKRGSLVKHPKFGVAYVGGFLKDRISLHRLTDGARLCQNARPSDCKFLAFNSWRTRLLPCLKTGVSAA